MRKSRFDFYKNKINRKYVKILSKSAPYTFKNPRNQYFSLPFHLILYNLHQKRSPLILLKLYQSCKYFFKKLFVLPIHQCQCFRGQVFAEYAEYNLNEKILFWFYDQLAFSPNGSFVFPRMYSCTIRNLSIGRIIISFDEFKLVTSDSMIEYFMLNGGNIVYSNCSTVTLNLILERLPHCVEFFYSNENERYSKETLLAMNKLKFNKKFSSFSVCPYFVSNDFYPLLLWHFLKENCLFDSLMSVNLLYVGNHNYAEIDANVKSALKCVFADWAGNQPKILSKKNFR